MAVQDLDDARGTAWILASAAKRSIEQRQAATPSGKVALGGLFRLLRAYRAHRLAGFAYQPHRDQTQEGMAIISPGESHVEELRGALQGALAEVYGDNQDAGLAALEHVLRTVAKEADPEPQEVERTSEFLGSFLRKLETVD
jgi:hypothetical protein